MNDLLGQWKKGISLPAQYNPSFLMNVTHLSVRSLMQHWYHFSNVTEKEIVKYLRNKTVEGTNRLKGSKSELYWMLHNVSTVQCQDICRIIRLFPLGTIFARCSLLGSITSQRNHLLHVQINVWLLWNALWSCARLVCDIFSRFHAHFFLIPHWSTLCWKLEIYHIESVYTTKVGACYKLGLPPFQRSDC